MKDGMATIPVCITSQMVITAGEATVRSVKWLMHMKWQMVLHLAGAILLRPQILIQTVIQDFIQASTITEHNGDNDLQMQHQLSQQIIFKPVTIKNGIRLKIK